MTPATPRADPDGPGDIRVRDAVTPPLFGLMGALAPIMIVVFWSQAPTTAIYGGAGLSVLGLTFWAHRNERRAAAIGAIRAVLSLAATVAATWLALLAGVAAWFSFSATDWKGIAQTPDVASGFASIAFGCGVGLLWAVAHVLLYWKHPAPRRVCAAMLVGFLVAANVAMIASFFLAT